MPHLNFHKQDSLYPWRNVLGDIKTQHRKWLFYLPEFFKVGQMDSIASRLLILFLSTQAYQEYQSTTVVYNPPTPKKQNNEAPGIYPDYILFKYFEQLFHIPASYCFLTRSFMFTLQLGFPIFSFICMIFHIRLICQVQLCSYSSHNSFCPIVSWYFSLSPRSMGSVQMCSLSQASPLQREKLFLECLLVPWTSTWGQYIKAF